MKNPKNFSFNADTYALGRIWLEKFFYSKDDLKFHGEDMIEFFSWVLEPEPSKRPQLNLVVSKLKYMLQDLRPASPEVYIPPVKDLFNLKNAISKKMHKIWTLCNPFFSTEVTKEEAEGAYGWAPTSDMYKAFGPRKDFALIVPIDQQAEEGCL